MSFENESSGDAPAAWFGGPSGTVIVDGKIVHGGQRAVRIERSTNSSGDFSTIGKSLPIDFTGSTVELRGFIRTEDVSGFAGLWVREDGDVPGVAFDNMQNRQLKGTTDWAEYSITLPLRGEAKQLFFGFLVSGTGRGWVDDLQLLIDGKPIWQAPKADRPKTALDTDHEFDAGSGIVQNELSPVQIENLATLGKVWGFLKYHHPVATSGQRHWDYELLRIIPEVLDARDRASANAVLLRWINGLGTIEQCQSCAKLNEADIHFRPNLEWIADKNLLGPELSGTLQSIFENRTPGKQFYVSKSPNVGNPAFDHELPYDKIRYPDAGFQLLGLYRFWNIIEYWNPYRDIIGEDWGGVLKQFIPRIALAKTSEAYQRELLALIARVHDTHANLWSSLQVRPPVGECQLPLDVRFIQERPVVVATSSENGSRIAGVEIGDVITELDGVSVEKLTQNWQPYYGASNRAALSRDIARTMTRGACGESSIGVFRQGKTIAVRTERVPNKSVYRPATHDLSGPAFRLLSKDVAYLKLSSVKAADAASYVQGAAGTKGLIIDIRNYPSEFVVFALGSLLVKQETDFSRFTDCDLSNPGAFHWSKQPVSIVPNGPHYAGKIVILVDEITQSQAEYTAMAFRAAGGVVIGSMTAGADGNASPFSLPGGFRTMISGIGIFYPDKSPTQRVGIVPDVKVEPTIAGVRGGRDEVLEEAVRQILGRDISTEQIKRMVELN